MKRARSKLTYANVISTVALFLVLAGGTAFAASQLAKNSVGTKQIKNAAVTPAKLSAQAKATLTGAQGGKGERGEKGDIGEPGTPASKLWAVVTQDETLSRGSGVEAVQGDGEGGVKVTFDQDVANCAFAGTIGESTSGVGNPAFVSVQPEPGNSKRILVRTVNVSDTRAAEPFYVVVFC